ncbi:MAG: PhoH family protein [Gammaproteobacteria bacterium]|jgi:PhoH-like ATPase|nr:MAG: PhoH family protein [Gammaproteobacteria bacterium]
MTSASVNATRLFVLDTNVLMHDATALYRFQEHDLFIPMVVLEELDMGKKGLSEVARNARQASRFIDRIIDEGKAKEIAAGLPIGKLELQHDGEPQPLGRLFLQTEVLSETVPGTLPGSKADNSILSITLSLQAKHPGRDVVLVSKDINLRIKARILGIHTEDYYNDKVLDDADLLYTGMDQLPDGFWSNQTGKLESWKENARTYYRVPGRAAASCYPNQCLYSNDVENFEVRVTQCGADSTTFVLATDYRKDNHNVWGIQARNREQNFALNLLMDPEVDLVTLLGVAGTGKTLLALAAGLQQTMEAKRYKEIIITRVTIPVGEDIGFLPGTEEEKMEPWMGALHDNLEVLNRTDTTNGDWGREATADLLNKRIKIRSLNFMRGRTFLNRYIIIDEAQNLTSKQMKTLITRAGPGSKIVCLGNISQIDTPYLSEITSGLTYVVDRFRNWEHSGHITLMRGERSRLADYASEIL